MEEAYNDWSTVHQLVRQLMSRYLNKTFLIWIPFSLGLCFLYIYIYRVLKPHFWSYLLLIFVLLCVLEIEFLQLWQSINFCIWFEQFFLEIQVKISGSILLVKVSSWFLHLKLWFVISLTWVTKSTTRVVRTLSN